MKKLLILFTILVSGNLFAMEAPPIPGKLEIVNYAPVELLVSWDNEKDRKVPAKTQHAVGLFEFDTNDLASIRQLHVKATLPEPSVKEIGAKTVSGGAVQYDLQKTLQEAKEAAAKEATDPNRKGQSVEIIIKVSQAPGGLSFEIVSKEQIVEKPIFVWQAFPWLKEKLGQGMKITANDVVDMKESPKPSYDEFKKRWQALTQLWHPDRNKEINEYATKVMQALNAANAYAKEPADKKKAEDLLKTLNEKVLADEYFLRAIRTKIEEAQQPRTKGEPGQITLTESYYGGPQKK